MRRDETRHHRHRHRHHHSLFFVQAHKGEKVVPVLQDIYEVLPYRANEWF